MKITILLLKKKKKTIQKYQPFKAKLPQEMHEYFFKKRIFVYSHAKIGKYPPWFFLNVEFFYKAIRAINEINKYKNQNGIKIDLWNSRFSECGRH